MKSPAIIGIVLGSLIPLAGAVARQDLRVKTPALRFGAAGETALASGRLRYRSLSVSVVLQNVSRPLKVLRVDFFVRHALSTV